jgi:predicted nucleic acid-binding protein
VIVIDASALVEALLRRSGAQAVNRRIFEPDTTIHAPHLIDLEVAHVVRRLAARGEISAADGERALDDLLRFPMERYSHEPLLGRVWALRHHHTAYDAAFLALAETLDAPLITRDGKLAASPGHHARVEVI